MQATKKQLDFLKMKIIFQFMMGTILDQLDIAYSKKKLIKDFLFFI